MDKKQDALHGYTKAASALVKYNLSDVFHILEENWT